MKFSYYWFDCCICRNKWMNATYLVCCYWDINISTSESSLLKVVWLAVYFPTSRGFLGLYSVFRFREETNKTNNILSLNSYKKCKPDSRGKQEVVNLRFLRVRNGSGVPRVSSPSQEIYRADKHDLIRCMHTALADSRKMVIFTIVNQSSYTVIAKTSSHCQTRFTKYATTNCHNEMPLQNITTNCNSKTEQNKLYFMCFYLFPWWYIV